MTKIDADYVFSKNGQIIYKELADGPALIDPYRRTLIRLNSTAQEIWKILDGKRSVTGIIADIYETFEIEEEELRKDVIAFLKDLIKREIIL